MSDMSIGDLASEIDKAGDQELALRLATVESIQTDTVSVKVAGSTTVTSGVDYVKYAPVVGQTVLVFQNGPNLVIWGIPGSTSSVPPGVIEMFGSLTAPPGYLLCDGRSTEGFPALAAAVGANVPDLRNKFIVGAGSDYAPGATGGSATVTLTTAQMPAHNHPNVLHGHATTEHGHATIEHGHATTAHSHASVNGRNVVVDGDATDGFVASAASAGGGAYVVGAGRTASEGLNIVQGGGLNIVQGGGLNIVQEAGANLIQNAGGGEAHENRPPYFTVAFIIKT